MLMSKALEVSIPLICLWLELLLIEQLRVPNIIHVLLRECHDLLFVREVLLQLISKHGLLQMRISLKKLRILLEFSSHELLLG